MIRYILARMKDYYEIVSDTISVLVEFLYKILFFVLELVLDVLIIITLPLWIIPFYIMEIWSK